MKKTQTQLFADHHDDSIQQGALKYGLLYAAETEGRHVFPSEEAIADLAHFAENLPDEPTDAESVIEQLQQYGAPATVNTAGGRYFGFVTGSYTPIGAAARVMATFWDQNSAMEVMSPICATLEHTVEAWLSDLLGLPSTTAAGFVSGSSAANIVGLAAGRYRLLQRKGWSVNEQGLNGAPKLRIVTGEKSHSSVKKAVSMLGLGTANIEFVPVDEQGRIIPAQMPKLDDLTLLILQAGEVNTGDYDDFEQLCDLANAAGSWVHIDGAFGLWAAAVPEFEHLTKGLGKADSRAVDGHKTLNMPYDSGIAMCADREAMTAALHSSGSYIVVSQKSRDGMFYTLEMSRNSRIVELWATLKYLGRNGVAEMIYGMHQRTVQFSKLFKEIPGFTVVNEVVFNQLLIRCATDELTEQVMEGIQKERECWAGSSSWGGHKVIRISVCSWMTTEEDVVRSVRSFERVLKGIETSTASRH